MRVPTLTDGVVTLRAHRDDDLEGVLAQCRDPEMQRWTTVPVPYSLEDAKTFVRHVVPGGWETDRAWEYAVSARDDDGVERFAGGVGLTRRGDGRAEVGYGTSPWARRRGLTERAVRLLLAWGFEERGLEVVDWVAARGNWASRRLAWRVGFAVGQERDWMQQRGALVPAWFGTLARGEELRPRHPWYDVPVLHGERVRLRALEDRDLPGIAETQSDATLRHFSEGPRGRPPTTDERGHDFVEGRREMVARGEAVHWTVTDPDDTTYLGHVQLASLQHRRQGELGFMAHPEARGRGLTTEAVRLALRHAFVPWDDGGLGLHRVQAWAAADNTASRRLLRTVGLTEGGRARREVLLGDGRWDDEVLYDVLADESAAAVDRRWSSTETPSTPSPSAESTTPTHAVEE